MNVNVTVKENGVTIETIDNRPVRKLEGGRAGVVYRKKIYPLYRGNFIEITDPSYAKEQFPCLGTGEELIYAQDKQAENSPVKHTNACQNPIVSSPPETAPVEFVDLDQDQKTVVEAPSQARMIVDAGPGTGKTEVACRRVAWLVNQCRIQPSSIILISFTRTAVHEIRNRIASLTSKATANSVQISTIDSLVWQIRSGRTNTARLDGNFEENILRLIDELEDISSIMDYLGTIRYIIIDEAQDIVEPRSELILKMLGSVSPVCGVTVFTDQAQAIYGFASADHQLEKGSQPEAISLLQRIAASEMSGGFKSVSLSRVYRTKSDQLLSVFTDVRSKVLSSGSAAHMVYSEVRDAIKTASVGIADGPVSALVEKLDGRSSFILFRTRVEVLGASSELVSNGIQHRVRMSGLPALLPAWIALALAEAEQLKISRSHFQELWDKNVAPTVFAYGNNSDESFSLLRRMSSSRDDCIDINRLRDRLSRHPPALTASEFGKAGPILSTIHASKGREAEQVILVLPEPVDDAASDIAVNLETKVMFVAASRARSRLLYGEANRVWHAPTEQGRACAYIGIRRAARIEVGRDGDISALGLAGKQFFVSAADVRSAQQTLLELAASPASLDCFMRKWDGIADQDNSGFRFYLARQHGQPLVVMEKSFGDDVFHVQQELKKRFFQGNPSPPKIKSLKKIPVFGLYTIAVSTNSPHNQSLHDPWRRTGLILAPAILGFPWGG